MIATSGSGANVSVGDVVAVHEGNDKRASWKLAQPLLSARASNRQGLQSTSARSGHQVRVLLRSIVDDARTCACSTRKSP